MLLHSYCSLKLIVKKIEPSGNKVRRQIINFKHYSQDSLHYHLPDKLTCLDAKPSIKKSLKLMHLESSTVKNIAV